MMPYSRNLNRASRPLQMVSALLTMAAAFCGLAQETNDWAGAKVTKTDLQAGETNYGKFAYFFASTMTRGGCHVAKVEGDHGKSVFVRRDGMRGRAYEDVLAAPVFSPDGSALAYAASNAGASFFVVNDREDPRFDDVLPETFAFSGDGKRHAYLAKKSGRLIAVVDGIAQPDTAGDMVPWLQPPVFSADGASVGYLEGSASRRRMRAVINGKPGETFDGLSADSLRFSADGRRFAYAANDTTAGNHWFWIVDGNKGAAFDTLGLDFAFSPDGKRTAYIGKKGQQWFVAVSDAPNTDIEGIVDHSLTFSPDSRHLAFAVAQLDDRRHIVMDGQAGPPYDDIGGSLPPGFSPNSASGGPGDYFLAGFLHGVQFSPDSRRLAYLATEKLIRKIVVVDGRPDDVTMDYMVNGMVFSDDSKRLAYGGRQGDRFFLVVDGKKEADYDSLGYFGFSPDGKHIAYTAGKGGRMVIVVDGRERAGYGSVPAGPIFRSDGTLEFLAAEKPSLYRFEVKL